MILSHKPKHGYSLLEIMVTVAIALLVGLLAYPTMSQFLVQSKVADALQSATAVQTMVNNKIANLGTATGSGTGITTPANLGRYVASCTVSANGVITLTTTAAAGAISLTLTPTYSATTEQVTWACAVSSSSLDSQVPSQCRI